MKYSVLMSVYCKDNPIWLDEAIKSMLNQTIKTDDFVIVCDGKLNNDLMKVIDKYKRKYKNIFNIIKKDHEGLNKALECGVLLCKNEIIARMDADDISIPIRIEKQLNYLSDNPNVSIVGSNVIEFSDNIENRISVTDLPLLHDDIVKFSKYRNPFRHPSMMYKKSKIIECGNYSSEFPYFEDYDLCIRLIQNGNICYNFKESLVYMRINGEFYKRRGGIKYLKCMINFRRKYYKEKYFSFYNYFVSLLVHSIICLVPNNFRKKFYKIILRKKV